MHEGVAPGRPLHAYQMKRSTSPNDSNHHSAAMGPSIFRRLIMRRITSPWAWVPRVLSKMTRQRGSMEMATLKNTNPGLLPGTGTVRQQIGTPDYQGWLRKLDNNSEECWKARFFVLKNSHLYYLRSDSPKENSLKGYINLSGCVILDASREDQSGGPYGFQIIHRREKATRSSPPMPKQLDHGSPHCPRLSKKEEKIWGVDYHNRIQLVRYAPGTVPRSLNVFGRQRSAKVQALQVKSVIQTSVRYMRWIGSDYKISEFQILHVCMGCKGKVRVRISSLKYYVDKSVMGACVGDERCCNDVDEHLSSDWQD
ncbi:hypothetical protein BD779DRAFT_1482493 [Infundibulicybe gibba]|nr:hypothetical protein BD779DRAFT_1482493 [Infundibulicybe gibba]